PGEHCRIHLQLEALQRLLEVRIAGGLDIRLERAERAVETEIVLIERPQAPCQRRLERGHDDVEEHAVAFEPEAARMRVVADQHVGRHLCECLQTVACNGDAVLDGALQHALHLADLIALLGGGALRARRLGRSRCRGAGRNRADGQNRCKPCHAVPLPYLTTCDARYIRFTCCRVFRTSTPRLFSTAPSARFTFARSACRCTFTSRSSSASLNASSRC